MDRSLIEGLLYEDEGPTLDFKRDQYKFNGGSDDDRSELLKDILGLANGWRRSDAYILIGVEEVRGGRSTVVGTTDHLADHTLQQFVNSRTNKPIQFGYEVCLVDGKQIGVICIDQQTRPFYLKKSYGKLKGGEVYVRRGSSTDPTSPATPEEIAQMGKALSDASPEAEISIEFADPEREDVLGVRIPWSAEWCDFPDVNDIPRLAREGSTGPLGINLEALQMSSTMERHNEHFYHDVAGYEFKRRFLRPIRLVVTNTGNVAASDVRVEIVARVGEGIGFVDESEIPERPEKRKSYLSDTSNVMKGIRPAFRRPGDVEIELGDDRFKLEMDCGNLQPGRKVWSDKFYIGVGKSGEVSLKGRILADNLAEPKTFTLTIDADIAQTSLSVGELIDLGDKMDDDQAG